MSNKVEEIFDLDGYHFAEDDFKLVQNEKKIYDTKFETKPTTYLKDALKRFKKNKSSVAGAFILGFLILCAIFVPIISQSDVVSDQSLERFLAPKLFEKGTGWWDGTKKYTDVVYDVDNKVPADFYVPAVSDISNIYETYINTANKYAKGGYINFVNEVITEDYENLSNSKFISTYHKVNYTSDGEFFVDVELGNIENVYDYQQGEYRIIIRGNGYEGPEFVVLKDWSREYSNFSCNISQILVNNGLKSYEGQFSIELKAGNNVQSYLLIKKFLLSCKDTALNEKLTQMSVLEPSLSVLLEKGTNNEIPVGYLSSSGQKNIYQAVLTKCSFVYDTYEYVYGDKTMDVAVSELNDYIKNGWCSYDYQVGPESFKVLSDKCPIVEIYSQKTDLIGKLSSVSANVTRYKFYGYDEMPSFILGTDESGYDIVKLSFKGLRTSLILGVCAATFCLLFGLCWGAISGYFGGNVDLFMERFCDILAGVPNLVIMTLCILHFGSKFITFFLALCMTGWMGTAGRTRTQFYRFKGREYVLASRTLGASDRRLIFRHILPNALGTIVTGSVLMIPSVIFSEASLSYLNLLTVKNSFGVILSKNQAYIQTYPALIVFPSLILALMMISFNLFGNGLRDALNPSLKGSD